MNYTAQDERMGITPEMGFEETAAKRLIGFALAQNDRELAQLERNPGMTQPGMSDNQFYGRLVNMVRVTAGEKGIQIIRKGEPKSNEDKLMRSVTGYYMNNLSKRHGEYSQNVQHMVELYLTSHPVIVDSDRLIKNVEKQLFDAYDKYGKNMWTNPDIKIVPEDSGRYTFPEVSLSEVVQDSFEVPTVRRVANSIVIGLLDAQEIGSTERVSGIELRGSDAEDLEDKDNIERVNVSEMHKSIFNDFMRHEGGYNEYHEQYPELNLEDLTLKALDDRMKEAFKENDNVSFEGEPGRVVDRFRLEYLIVDQIKQNAAWYDETLNGFNVKYDQGTFKTLTSPVEVLFFNNEYLPVSFLPETAEVFKELQKRSFEINSKVFNEASGLTKGLNSSDNNIMVEINGKHLEVPVSRFVHTYKVENGEYVPVKPSEISRIASEGGQFKVTYDVMNEKKLQELAEDVTAVAYAAGYGRIESCYSYAARKMVQDIEAKTGGVLTDSQEKRLNQYINSVVESARKADSSKWAYSDKHIVAFGLDYGSVRHLAFNYMSLNGKIMANDYSTLKPDELVKYIDSRVKASRYCMLAGIDERSVINVRDIERTVDAVIHKAAANNVLFESNEQIHYAGKDYGSVKDFAHKYHEYQDENGAYFNEGAGLKELVARVSWDIVSDARNISMQNFKERMGSALSNYVD